MPKWKEKWQVNSSSSDRVYTVSRDETGNVWGCSCPVWKFQRKECHHIQEIKSQLAGGGVQRSGATNLPEYVLANVKAPTVKDGKMLIPLVRIGDVGQEPRSALSCSSKDTAGRRSRYIAIFRKAGRRRWSWTTCGSTGRLPSNVV